MELKFHLNVLFTEFIKFVVHGHRYIVYTYMYLRNSWVLNFMIVHSITNKVKICLSRK